MSVQGVISTELLLWHSEQAFSTMLKCLEVDVLCYKAGVSENKIPAVRSKSDEYGAVVALTRHNIALNTFEHIPAAYVAVYVTVASWLPVMRHPIKLQVSPCIASMQSRL